MSRPLARTTYDKTAAALHARYVHGQEDWRRDHLGASIAGHPCDRFLWLSFRWALAPNHEGRMLRLFDRGHREEAWIIEDLRAIGVQVDDRDHDGNQPRVTFGGGHVAGGVDGIVRSGLPDAPNTEHVLECKTHRKASFDKLVEQGVKRAKPQHYVQMQVYMKGLHIAQAVYVAVCKDDDRIHVERVAFDDAAATAALERAEQIVREDVPPQAYPDPDQPPCVYTSKEGERFVCQFHALCHGDAIPERNCRTCTESVAKPDGTWRCNWFAGTASEVLTPDGQRQGCADHVTIAPMFSRRWQVARVEVRERRVTLQHQDGRVHIDGRKS